MRNSSLYQLYHSASVALALLLTVSTTGFGGDAGSGQGGYLQSLRVTAAGIRHAGEGVAVPGLKPTLATNKSDTGKTR